MLTKINKKSNGIGRNLIFLMKSIVCLRRLLEKIE